jgi:hypothetical protein
MSEIEHMNDAELAAEVMDLTAEVVELVKLLRSGDEPSEADRPETDTWYGPNIVDDNSIVRNGVGGWNR